MCPDIGRRGRATGPWNDLFARVAASRLNCAQENCRSPMRRARESPMAANRHERRTKWMINPAMQGRIVFRMAAVPAAVLAGIAVFTGIYCADVLGEARALDEELPDLMPLIWLVMAFELVAAGLLVMHALRLSHTIAGPAYRIAKSLQRIRSGDFAFRVQLRKGDHLTELRDEMNLLLDWLQQNPPHGEAPGAPQQDAAAPAPTAAKAPTEPATAQRAD